MNDPDWTSYVRQTERMRPRPVLVTALDSVVRRGRAIDLGSGALVDATYLLDQDFAHVTALDQGPFGQAAADRLPRDRFAYVISRMEDFDFPAARFDLVNAQYALPFIAPAAFDATWRRIRDALCHGGVFAGQFFGDRDGWRDAEDMTFRTAPQVADLLAGLDIVSLVENEHEGPTASGHVKQWHVFDVIALRPAP